MNFAVSPTSTAFFLIFLFVAYVMERHIRAIRQSCEKSAIANRLTAIYAREICREMHDPRGLKNTRGQLFRWQDPAEKFEYVRNLLLDIGDLAERKRKREEQYGPILSLNLAPVMNRFQNLTGRTWFRRQQAASGVASARLP